jgi:hypothetical protein
LPEERSPTVSNRLARLTSALIGGVLALALAGSLARAADPEPHDLRYGVYWAGLQIATLKLKHEVAPAGYKAKLVVETVGLTERLVRYRARTLAAGEVAPDRGLLPQSFSSEYQTRKKARRAVVTFDPASGDVVDLAITKRGKPDRSKVPEELRKGVIDPLSAFLGIREHLARMRPGTPYHAPVFDGRRRYDLEASVVGHDRATIAGREQPVLRLALAVTFVAGADPDDLDEIASDPERMQFDLLLSDDERLLPLQMRMQGSLLPASIELLQDCSGAAGCQLAAN